MKKAKTRLSAASRLELVRLDLQGKARSFARMAAYFIAQKRRHPYDLDLRRRLSNKLDQAKILGHLLNDHFPADKNPRGKQKR